MKPLSRDTPLEVEEVWLQALRRRGGIFQLERLAEMVDLGRQAARVAILRAHPDAGAAQVDETLLRESYGDEAARRVIALRGRLGFYGP